MNTMTNKRPGGLYKRLKNLFAIFAIFSTVSLVLLVTRFNHYSATAKITVMGLEGAAKTAITDGADKVSDRAMRTVASAVKSRYILDEIVTQLHLENAFGKNNAIDVLQNMIDTRPVRGTHIINITVNSKKPELAAQIANTIARLVVTDFYKKRFEFERDITVWFAEQAGFLRKEVDEAASQLRNFMRELSAPDINLEHDMLIDKIKKTQFNLGAIKSELQKAEISYNNIKSQLDAGVSPRDLIEVKKDDSYAEVMAEYLVIEQQVKQLSERYNPDHPELANRQAKLNAAERMLSARPHNIISAALTNKQVLELRAKESGQVLKKYEEDLILFEKQLDTYKSLLNNLREKEVLYDALIGRVEKEIDNIGLSVLQVSMFDKAYLPRKKNMPNIWVVVLIVIVCSGLLEIIYNGFIYKNFFLKDKIHTTKRDNLRGMYIERVQEDS